MSDKKPTLRSAQWFGTADKNGFMYRSWMRSGHRRPPVSWQADHRHLQTLVGTARATRFPPDRGARQTRVIEAGCFPVEFPVFSNGESNLRPTAMFTRNLTSMDVEEAIRGNPIDGVVLLTGCDKTTPALLMGAASCDVPAIVVTGGPMLNGKHKGKDIGSGTVVWQLSEQVKAGTITIDDFLAAEGGMSRSAGTCNTMGTASTWRAWPKRWALRLRTTRRFQRWDARRYVLAHMSGMRAVEMFAKI